MTLEQIREFALSLAGVTEDIKWENHLCFNIGGKMFLVTSPDSVPVTATVQVKDDEFDEISKREGFKPAPYMAKYKWVYISDISLLPDKEWKSFIKTSYDLKLAKLSKKVRASIH